MGFFDRERIAVATQVLPLVEETPEVIKQSVLNSILSGSDISTDILNTINNCLATKVNKFHRYAEKSYTNGLLDSSVGTERVPAEKVQEALDGDYPPPVGHTNAILSVAVGNYDVDKIAYEWLGLNTDFDLTTNEWTEEIGGVLRTVQFFAALKGSDDVVVVTGTYRVSGSLLPAFVSKEAKFNYKMIDGQDYYMAQYVVINDTTAEQSSIKLWNYQISSNKYPDMELDYSNKDSLYMPVVPIRIDNESYTDEAHQSTELYKTSKKLLSILGISIEELDEGVNGNPDIEEVDHAYFTIGIDPKNNHEAVNEYLFLFFNDLAAKSPSSKGDFYDWYNGDLKGNQPPVNGLWLHDDTYKTTLAWNYIDNQLIAGSVGKVGSIVKVIDATHGTERVTLNGFLVTMFTIESPKNVLILRKQVSETHYQELTVSGLFLSNEIYKAKGKNVVTSLSSDGEEGQVILIPLNLSIINDMPTLKANTLMYYSLNMVFNAYVIQKLEWYETGFFQLVTVVVAIAIGIVTGGFSSIFNGIIGALGGSFAAIIVVVQDIIKSIVISAAFKFVAEELGLEFALTLVAIITVLNVSDSLGLIDLPDAMDFLDLNAVNSSMAGVSEGIQARMEQLQLEAQEFAEDAEEKMDELEEIQNTLNKGLTIDPFQCFMGVGMYPNESIDMYLQRNTSNINAIDLGITSVTHYVDIALTLPNRPY